jgi:hypothetical protein
MAHLVRAAVPPERISSMGRKFLVGVVALMASGCGSSDAVRVSGTLVRDGKPVVVEEGQWVQMLFYEVDPKVAGESFPANVGPDGSFDLPGKEGSGIPVGKYKVVIRWVTHKDRTTDALKDAFTLEKSPIVVEIQGSRNLTIDLSAAKAS